MGATRKTDNVDLPLFDKEDKPSWMGDVNGAMEKIDAAFVAQQTRINEQDAIILSLQQQIASM